jgi:hypothetical protein
MFEWQEDLWNMLESGQRLHIADPREQYRKSRSRRFEIYRQFARNNGKPMKSINYSGCRYEAYMMSDGRIIGFMSPH